jgi:hypothetical protein
MKLCGKVFYYNMDENSMKEVVEGYGFVDPHQKLLSKWFIDETIDENEWIAELKEHGVTPDPIPDPPE